MCWTPAASAAFGTLSSLAAAVYHRRGDARKAAFFAYFAFMECLQLAQHAVLGDCGSSINAALTAAAWVHVSFQPFIINWCLLSDDVHPAAASAINRMSAAVGVLLALRLPFQGNPVAALGSLLPGLPDLPPASLAGRACGGVHDALCGGVLCSFQGATHIAWSVPLLPATYFLPGAWAHFAFFLLPALLLAGPRAPVRRVVVVVALLLGPVLSMALLAGTDHYAREWPSLWCLVSAAMTFLIPLGDFVAERAGPIVPPPRGVVGAVDSATVLRSARRPVALSPASSPAARRPLLAKGAGTPGRGV